MRQHLYRTLYLCVITFGLSASLLAADLNGGIWYVEHPPHALLPTDGGRAPLLPDAQRIYNDHIAARNQKNLDFDPTEKCKPPGIPRLLLQPQPFEFLQRSDRIFIVHQWNRLVRVIDMDVPQPESLGPTYLGQSIGHWQGNTLVVDSQSFNDTTLLDDAGMPHSDELHITEQYTLSPSAQRLTLRMRIDDPKTFSRPWETVLRFKRDLTGRLAEDVCVERKKLTFWKASQP